MSGLVAENRVGGRCTRRSCRVVRVQERSLARCPGSAGTRGNKKSPSRNSWKELQSDGSLSELIRKSGPKIVAIPPLHACLHVGGSAQLDQTGHLAMTVAGSGLEKELWIQHLSVSRSQLDLLWGCAGGLLLWSQDDRCISISMYFNRPMFVCKNQESCSNNSFQFKLQIRDYS